MECAPTHAASVGGGTRYWATADVLSASGPDGDVANIMRGSIIDQTALIDALNIGKIASAGLDLLDGAPAVPLELAAVEKLKAFLAGKPFVTTAPREAFNNSGTIRFSRQKNSPESAVYPCRQGDFYGAAADV